jgi:NAD dependent epimerase/dehydratase family enzyme
VTNAGFARVLGQVLNRPAALPAPGFALKPALGEMATVVLDGQRAVPERLTATALPSASPNSNRRCGTL